MQSFAGRKPDKNGHFPPLCSDKHFYDREICINFILVNGIVFRLEFSLHMNLF